ncbi:hypothetical protein B0H14DRAFT_2591416 [Mycena olivaceomarginata]|nr:hypothetical protein B0H14DRAFT_2591416 [Mycena olivaceomarginata]
MKRQHSPRRRSRSPRSSSPRGRTHSGAIFSPEFKLLLQKIPAEDIVRLPVSVADPVHASLVADDLRAARFKAAQADGANWKQVEDDDPDWKDVVDNVQPIFSRPPSPLTDLSSSLTDGFTGRGYGYGSVRTAPEQTFLRVGYGTGRLGGGAPVYVRVRVPRVTIRRQRQGEELNNIEGLTVAFDFGAKKGRTVSKILVRHAPNSYIW